MSLSQFRSAHLPLASIHNFGLEVPPGNAISEGRLPLCNTSSKAGALDTGSTYREWLGPKIFEDKMFSKFFWKPLFSTIHVNLIIMSRKYFFRSPDLPFDMRFWTRGFLLVMRSRKAGLPFATRARKRSSRYRRYVSKMTRTKFSKTKFFQSFSENHFFPRCMSPWSLWNIFSIFKSGPEGFPIMSVNVR